MLITFVSLRTDGASCCFFNNPQSSAFICVTLSQRSKFKRQELSLQITENTKIRHNNKLLKLNFFYIFRFIHVLDI